MLKCIALLRRRPDITPEAFIDYYETRHSVLISNLLPDILAYRRNYVDRESAFVFAGAQLDFDVVTELHFADRAAYERFTAFAGEPAIAAQIAADEENLFDRSATRMFVVEERASSHSERRDPIAALLDERAIIRGLSRFARILDGKQWDRLGDVFAGDICFDYGSGRDEHGMAALTDNMRRFLDRCGGTQHLIGSISVDLDGDRAISRAYVQARHQRVDDPAGPIFDSNGEYVDQWERRAEGWRIVRRDAIWATHSGDPAILQARTADLG